jgi:hypothetical protein
VRNVGGLLQPPGSVLLRLTYLGLTNAFEMLRLLPISDREKDGEILAVRYQNAVLERHLSGQRVRFEASDRAFLAALLQGLPTQVLRRMRLLVRLDTVLRWSPRPGRPLVGFLPHVSEVLDQVHPDGQRMLFSATLDRDVDQLVSRYLHGTPGTRSTSSPGICGPAECTPRPCRSGKSQPQRTRTLAQFKNGQITALAATNAAARGLHVDHLDLVVNVGPPTDPKDYVHRGPYCPGR